MREVEDLIKAGLILILGAILFSEVFMTATLAKSFASLGIFMIVIAIIIAILSVIIPLLKKL